MNPRIILSALTLVGAGLFVGMGSASADDAEDQRFASVVAEKTERLASYKRVSLNLVPVATNDEATTYVTYPNTEPLPDGSIITDPGTGAPPIIIRPLDNPYPETTSEYDVPWPCGVIDTGTGAPPIIHACTNR